MEPCNRPHIPETPYPHLPGEITGIDEEYAAIQLDRAKVFALGKQWYLAMDAMGRAFDAIERVLACQRDAARHRLSSAQK